MSTNKVVTKSDLKDFYDRIYPYLGAGVQTGFTPVGTVISVMGNEAPANYLVCDGTVYNIVDYPVLANYFEEQFEASNFFGGNGTTTFAVPDLRGEFLRGAGTNSHTGQGSGGNVGVHQNGTVFPNNHVSSTPNFIARTLSNASTSNVQNPDSSTNSTKYAKVGGTFDGSASSGVANFTARPTNTSVLYCIATKNIYIDAKYDYSTDEKVVGTWIDGKPVYQKTINCGAMPNNAEKSVSIGVADLDKVCDFSGFSTNGTDTIRLLPHVWPTSSYLDCVTFNKVSDDWKVTLKTSSDRSAFTAYVTIQYTKTTD